MDLLRRIRDLCCGYSTEDTVKVVSSELLPSRENLPVTAAGESCSAINPSSNGEEQEITTHCHCECTDRAFHEIVRLGHVTDKLWSAVRTLRSRQDYGDADLDEILRRLNISPNNILEEQETISGVVNGDAEGHENTNANSNSAIQAIPRRNLDNECYNMNHKNRGKCLIFSHEFYKEKWLERRECADDEAKLINDVFEKLGFDVKIHKDCKHRDIKKILKKCAKYNYENDDCIFIFVLTHGQENGLVWAYDYCYSIDIFEETLSNIPTLAGKPKSIYAQTCRGEKVDKGINVKYLEHNSEDETDYTRSSQKLPSKADFYIVHSTAPGFVSFRQWMIPIFCKILDRSSETDDIDEIMMKTTEEMSYYESVHKNIDRHGAKQVPCVLKTLRKRLYLKRKVNSAN